MYNPSKLKMIIKQSPSADLGIRHVYCRPSRRQIRKETESGLLQTRQLDLNGQTIQIIPSVSDISRLYQNLPCESPFAKVKDFQIDIKVISRLWKFRFKQIMQHAIETNKVRLPPE